jgi:hypothetical protein
MEIMEIILLILGNGFRGESELVRDFQVQQK